MWSMIVEWWDEFIRVIFGEDDLLDNLDLDEHKYYFLTDATHSNLFNTPFGEGGNKDRQ